MKVPNWKMRFINVGAGSQKTRAEQEEADFVSFVANVVRPAYSEIARRLFEKGREITTQETRAACGITVVNGNSMEIMFRITGLSMPAGVVPNVEVKMRERKGLRVESKKFPLRSPSEKDCTITGISADDIIECFFCYYGEALGRI